MNATFSQINDFIERPTTSSQVTSSVLPDSSCKYVITKLFVIISEGIVFLETNDFTPYAPLSNYLEILRNSKLSHECHVAIQFYASDQAIPYKYGKSSDKPAKEFTSLDQLKTFAEQIRSIAYLWSHFPISAYFGQYRQTNNNALSQSDYCTELFSGEQSILQCKDLDVTLVNYWPLSIITNVVDKCELNLEEAFQRGNRQLYDEFPGNRLVYDEFLDEIYGGEVLQRIRDISLRIPIEATANDFIGKLKERFQRSPHKRFKFGLCSPSKEVHKLKDQMNDHILVANSIDKAQKNSCSWVMIEQRAAGP
ncbi:hypothetical protein Ddc_14595 [Ditylenchus destructor]|nr:hypothetical protein Ddc_14595 [Ditylenchus destructor]